LNSPFVGVPNHFVKQHGDTAFIAANCDMIPIEWVTRRVATGSFLKRNAGVLEGHRFCPPKLETFFKVINLELLFYIICLRKNILLVFGILIKYLVKLLNRCNLEIKLIVNIIG
jgi:hypothetical protein